MLRAWRTGVGRGRIASAVLVLFLLFVRDARAGCAEARLVAYEAIPAAFATGDADSVLQLVDAWRADCGPRPEIVRVEVLALLWADRFDEWRVDTRFVDHLAEIELLDRQRASVLADSTLDPLLGAERFAVFCRDLAADVARYTLPGTEDYLLARFYAGDHDELWARAEVEPYASTALGQMIAIRRAQFERPFPRFFLGGSIGAWEGFGGLRDLGRRVTLGAHGGVRSGPVSARLNAEVQLGEADALYFVNDGDDVYGTDRLHGASVQIEPAARIASRGDFALELTGAIGWAGIEALEAETVETDGPQGREVFDFPAVWIHTASFGLGANLRWERSRRFVELQVRHGWQDWDTGRGGSDLDGSTWQIRLVLGAVAPPRRAERWADVIAPPVPPGD